MQSSPIKILNVVYSYGKGGTERAAQNFATGYNQIGCDSRIISTREDGPRSQFLRDMGIVVYFLDEKGNSKEICDWQPDVVHVHSHGIQPSEFERIQALCPNAKFVETNVFSKPSPWAGFLSISYQLSHWCQWLFCQRSKNRFRSAIVPNPVDTEAFARASKDRRDGFRSQYGFTDTDLIIGRIGQNFDGKWSSLIVDVFEDIRKNTPSLKLLIVNAPSSVLNRVSRSIFKHDVICIDKIIGDDALADCYSSIDVFLLIADQGESFGMVLAESLLCETPVVTMMTPWGDNSQSEVVGNKCGGFVASTKFELIDLVECLLFDKSRRNSMGRAGRERVIAMFDSKIVAKKSLDLISSSEIGCVPTLIDPACYVSDGFGRINLASRLILKFGQSKYFGLLRVTLGYKSLTWIFRRLLSLALRKPRHLSP